MSKYFGDILEDGTIEIPFNTYNADGASITFTGTTVKVYKDSATGTEVTAGVTLSKDHDGITGVHLVTIVATDASYTTGSDYLVELQAATIDTQTVNSFLGTFSIQNRYMRGTDGVDTATMRGTDGVDTATMRGTDGVDTATMRGTDGANTTVPDAAGVAPTAVENRQEMDSNSTKLIAILADVTGIDGAAMRGTDDAATETKQDAGDVVTSRIAAIQEGDEDFDFANGTVETFPKGTTSGGLLKKNLYDKNDDIVADTEAIIARTEDVTP